ncbi:MAG TPA: response regulator [Kiritimatiellia bacterium]|nr:response regulator [Kiritimatiellia bacterium]HRZ13410.1 response regulator [Kiritimatiellia bacterium]HSA18950.1 response regulator [Kiritimatiellia bacterium]
MTFESSPERLEALDYISDGLLVADAGGRVVFSTPSIAGLLGRAPATLGELSALLKPDGGPSFDSVLNALEREGRWSGEATGHPPRGAERLLDIRAERLLDAKERTLGYVFVARDVARERLLVKQVMQAQQMELVEHLSGGIAHEFKNLLTIIMAYASLLRDQMPSSDLQADVARIQQAAQAANDLTARLLAVARHSTPVLEDVDIHDVLGDIVALQKKALPRNITLSMPERETLPRVRADRATLDRALLNLCLNARDAMPEGGKLTLGLAEARLSDQDIQSRPEQRPGHYLVISVSDTGPGIPPEIQDRVFEPFFTTRKAATGMGLTVVRHAVRAMGGWVTLHSEPGLGACFELHLPTADTPSAAVSGPGPDEGPGPGGTERILAVDDDPLALSIAQRILQRAGYSVHGAPGGEEAIEYFRQRHAEIDLVVLDVVMPYVNGEDVYREIHRIKPGIPVLLVSGFTPKTAERLIRITGAQFLTKPFTQRGLAQAVRDALDRNKA